MRTARAHTAHLLTTHLVVDLRRELVIAAKFEDGTLMPICSGCVISVPCQGTGAVDGGNLEARKMLGSYRMEMR